MNDVSQNGCYSSPLGFNNVDWIVDELIKVEKKLNFFFKNTKKDIVKTEEDEEVFEIIILYPFSEKKYKI